MSAQACPWLEDLDDDWVQPPEHINPASKSELTSADHDANSLRSSRSRIPRRSSGAFSNSSTTLNQQSSYNTDSLASTKRNRNPLGELSTSAGNAVHDASRSVSIASAGSVIRYDTVDRKSSPGKQQATLEWKRRLVHGEVGYGDQTDLFGANGLENIFAAPAKPSPRPDKPNSRTSKLFRMQDPLPSSPPPWPSTIDFTSQSTPAARDDPPPCNLDQVQEESQEEDATYEDIEAYAEDQDLPSQADESLQDDKLQSRQEPQEESEIVRPESSPYHLPIADKSSIRTAFLASANADHPGNRTISGQTDFSGEAFSPVFISKHTTLTGQIDYATMDSHTLKQLERVNQMHSKSDSSESNAGDESQTEVEPSQLNEVESQLLQDLLEDTLPSVPEVSLPDNLPTGTPPIATLGNFVNLKRGGLSAYGSFKDRPLSPSQSDTLRSRLSAVQQSHQTSELDGSVVHNPEKTCAQPVNSIKRPGTPDKYEPSLLSPPKPRSSASPLKLFGNYDTFTNNRLLRRLSQLEDVDQDVSQASVAESDKPEQASEDPFVENPSSPTLAHGSSTQRDQDHKQRAVSSLSSFGEGELDDHDFEADLSFPSGLNLDPADSMCEGSPPPGIAPPGSRTPFRFHVEESSPDASHTENLKRKLSKRSTAKSRASGQYSAFDRDVTPHDNDGDVSQWTEGKRPRSSPSKAPTPKRRRTLVALHGEMPGMGYGSEIDVKITRTEIEPYHSAEQDTYLGTTKRNLTRPRNPTPSQRSRDDIQAEVEDATLDFLSSSPRLEAIRENLDLSEIPTNALNAEQAKAVAAEVAAFTLNISKAESDGKRNRSITTQDFLDEAMHIMALIRAKGRPRSGLGSVEESDAEDVYGSHLRPEHIERSPSPLRVSRPPSREGGSTGWRPRSQMQQDPRIVSQLRKFQESDDIDLLETSIKSLHVEERGEHQFSDEAIIAEGLANIRINGPRPQPNHQRGESDTSRTGKSASPTKTHTSHPSVDSSAGGRTIGTSSTRKSDNVATLAPETVAHLIPEEVAGMTFDRDRQRWVRIKGSRRRSYDTPHPSSNITSDDDPFNEIPDLTVDEVKELTRIQGLYTRSQQSFFDQSQVTSKEDQEEETRVASAETVLTRPVTRDNPIAPPFASSSAHSKYSGFASSRTQVETRATSWSNEELAGMARSKQHQVQTASVPPAVSDIPEIADEESFTSEDESLPLDDSVTEELPLPAPKQRQYQPFVQSSPGSIYRPGGRQFSLRRQTLNRGFHGQDQSEMSFIAQLPDKRLMSLSVSVSAPPAKVAPKVSAPSQELIVPSSSPARLDATFYLSDLPEFTLHDVDPERSSEKLLAKRVAEPIPGDRFDMAVQSLVKTLTDVEPDEPYWEDIKQLSLRERNLGSVHNLEDFCTRLEDLDLSNNEIAHLDGAPNSIRRLNVRSNSLSSLTAWSHLMNLQYLDISNNSIDSLGGLCMLYHLRELKADNNQITSLDGVMGLDGLLNLSVRRNKLGSVDFEGCQMNRLEELDLGGNQLVSISGTNSLPSLTRMSIDGNELRSFSLFDGACPKLTVLSLQKNHLSDLNLSSCPNLQYLNVDSNQLSTITGLEHLRHLDVLSMRKQTVPVNLLSSHLHTRSLYLSANIIADLSLPHAFHSIQTLELASCGLESLPSDFGLNFPNLRTLNISFNAIEDIRPLLNIAHLSTLHAAGNRITRLRKTVAVLTKLRELQRCDMRENPFTLGLYPPLLPNPESRDLVSTALSPEPATADTETEEVRFQRKMTAAYILPAADMGTDMDALTRMDEDTRLRRKVYELLVVNGCPGLTELDGLALDRGRVLMRDWAWGKLVELGILRKSGRSVASALAEE